MISHISFTPLTNEEISCLPITIDYNSDFARLIKSEAFGAVDDKCLTCHNYEVKCQGHWGKVSISTPLIKPAFKTYIENVIGNFCFHCGLKIQITDEENNELLDKTSKNRIQVINNLRSRLKTIRYTQCGNCSSPALNLKFNNDTGMFHQDKHNISIVYIYLLLKNIPRHYYTLFSNYKIGMENFFWETYFPIPPLFVRRDISMFKGQNFLSNLTKNYIDFVSKISSYNTAYLQKKITEIEISKEITPSSSLCQSILGKRNFIRDQINGVRGDNVTRILLNCNASFKLETFIACRESYDLLDTIIVNRFTISIVMRLFKENKIINFFSNDKLYKVGKKKLKVLFGDIVEINVSTSIEENIPVYVMVSRQPALHKGSICAMKLYKNSNNDTNSQSHTVSTFCLNGMNGDQDGDDLNTKQCKSIEAKYEQSQIMLPRYNLISEGSGTLAYGLIQTEVLALIKLSMMKLTQHQINQLTGKINAKKSMSLSEILPLFETFTTQDVTVGGSVNNVFKNVSDTISVKKAIKLFETTADICKNSFDIIPISISIKDFTENLKFHEEQQVYTKNELIRIIEDGHNEQDLLSYYKTSYKKLQNKLATKYSDLFSSLDPTTNGFALLAKSGMKLNAKIYSEMEEPNYLGRLLPSFYYNDTDPRNYGFIQNSLMFGLTLTDMANSFYSVNSKLVITTKGTAVSGKLGRDLVKCLEDISLNSLRFTISGKNIIDFCPNFFKVSNKDLYMLEINHEEIKKIKEDNEWNKALIESYNIVKNSIISIDGKSISKEISFPVNVPYILKTSNKSNNKLTLKIVIDFVNDINLNYFFSFLNVNTVKFVLLYFMKDLDGDYTKVFNALTHKLKHSSSGGDPVGMQAALTVSEIITQSTLSNFHATKKTGEEISLNTDANNVRNIYLKKEIINGIVIIQTKNIHDYQRLIDIKTRLEHVRLDMLNIIYSKEFISRTKTSITTKFIIQLTNLKNFHLNKFILELMFENHLSTMMYIDNSILLVEATENDAKVTIILTTIECTIKTGKEIYGGLETNFDPEDKEQGKIKPETHIVSAKEGVILFELSLRFISKGEICYSKWTLNYVNLIDGPQWELIMINNDHTLLSNFDTSNLNVIIPIENVNKYFGLVHTYNTLKMTYSASKLVHNHFRLISQFQCQTGFPTRIKKSSSLTIPCFSRIGFENNYFDLQDNVITNTIDKTNTLATSIFLSQPHKLGIGFYEYFIDPSSYLIKEEKKTIKTYYNGEVLI